ncbi:hypothetical protein T484DRAFT_1857808 [Baffinella frigidus]|nr:hypothetical protein T484DRAFT_1857808 [Cryptophyta sp. CCMP2293]
MTERFPNSRPDLSRRSPAAISGQVQRGDFIVQVGDVPVQGATVAQCKKLIQAGSGL